MLCRRAVRQLSGITHQCLKALVPLFRAARRSAPAAATSDCSSCTLHQSDVHTAEVCGGQAGVYTCTRHQLQHRRRSAVSAPVCLQHREPAGLFCIISACLWWRCDAGKPIEIIHAHLQPGVQIFYHKHLWQNHRTHSSSRSCLVSSRSGAAGVDGCRSLSEQLCLTQRQAE
jgi:hypothetical protein